MVLPATRRALLDKAPRVISNAWRFFSSPHSPQITPPSINLPRGLYLGRRRLPVQVEQLDQDLPRMWCVVGHSPPERGFSSIPSRLLSLPLKVDDLAIEPREVLLPLRVAWCDDDQLRH